MASEFLVSFLGAVQASLSVLLTIGFGVAAAQFGLVTTKAAEEVSRLCVRVLLPCLLIVKLGSELHLDTAVRYVPIVVWALVSTITSIFIGKAAVALFRLPTWVIPAIAFNNTESLPLLLLQSLETTGVLATLVGSGEASEGIERARTYFLACSVVNNTITFSQGGKWITGKQQSSDEESSEDPESQQTSEDGQRGDASEETESVDDNDDSLSDLDERTSLLPRKVVYWERRLKNGVGSKLRDYFYSSPRLVQKILTTIGTFINPPFIGAAIGLIIGLSPPLHRLFFNDMDQGGYFNAMWETSSCLSKSLSSVSN